MHFYFVPVFVTTSPNSLIASAQRRLSVKVSTDNANKGLRDPMSWVQIYSPKCSLVQIYPHPTTPVFSGLNVLPKCSLLQMYSPQIFRGASSSKRMGWLRKSSLDFKHSPRISFSVNWTFLPGRDPLTENKKGLLIKCTFISFNNDFLSSPT